MSHLRDKQNSHNVCTVQPAFHSTGAVPLEIIQPPHNSSFVLCPTYVYRSEDFFSVSARVGGLIHLFDAAYLLGKGRNRIHALAAQSRLTRYRFPFGVFLAGSEVAIFSSGAPGRPAKFHTSEKNQARNHLTEQAVLMTRLREKEIITPIPTGGACRVKRGSASAKPRRISVVAEPEATIRKLQNLEKQKNERKKKK